jgi:hypothetical protein
MNSKPASLAGLRQRANKGPPIRVVSHDRLPTISTCHHVIKRSSKFTRTGAIPRFSNANPRMSVINS